MYQQVGVREDIVFFGSGDQLRTIIFGLEKYEMALHGAPYRTRPLAPEEAARQEIGKVQRLAGMCKHVMSSHREPSKPYILRGVSQADGELLEAGQRLWLRHECRRLDQEIEALKRRKTGAKTLDEQRNLDEKVEELSSSLETNRDDERGLPEGILNKLLLPADQILDICDGVDIDDPGRDIL